MKDVPKLKTEICFDESFHDLSDLPAEPLEGPGPQVGNQRTFEVAPPAPATTVKLY